MGTGPQRRAARLPPGAVPLSSFRRLDSSAWAHRCAHLSASQFGRVFEEVYGETPHRYLQRRRVERAMTLLRQTDRPITDVAWDVGFASLGTFSRTFSNIVGCSPTEFRTAHQPVAVPSCFIAAWTRPREPETVVSEKRTGVDAD